MKIFNVREGTNFSIGADGFKEITATETAPTGTAFCVITSDTDATYSATSLVGDNLSSQSRTAGNIRFGVFSEIAVTSGTVLAYYFPIVE